MKNLSVKLKKVYSGFLIVFSIIVIITVCFFMNLWYKFGITLKQIPSVMTVQKESQPVLLNAPEVNKEPETVPQEEIPETGPPAVIPVYEEIVPVSAEPEEVITKNPFMPVCPIAGKEFGEYKGDKLTFSSLFDDWRIYNGVDIYAEENTPVLAIEEGTVEKIINDKILGISIIISHSEGYSSVYENLSTDTLVSEGENVTREQIISGMGTNKFYKDKNGNYLHFELKKNGKDINPSDI